MKKDYKKLRQEKLNYLGNKCVMCGTTENLEFDHINPKDKSFDVSSYMRSMSQKVIKELNKCQLLCRPCHRRKSELEGSVKVKKRIHGTEIMYNHGKCRCTLCKSAHTEKARNYRKSTRVSSTARTGSL